MANAGCSTLTAFWPGPDAAQAKAVAGMPPLNEGAATPMKTVGSDSAEAAKLSLSVAADLEKSGHPREAALQLELARKHDPKLNLSRRLAGLYRQAGEQASPKEQPAYFAKAVEEYQRALAAAPNTPELHNDLGHCLLLKGDAVAAEASFRQALALNPKLERARVNLGLALGGQGRVDEALAEFRQVVSPAEAHCNLAFVLLKNGDAAGAKAQYRLALRENPNLKLAQDRLRALENVLQQSATPGPAASSSAAASPALAASLANDLAPNSEGAAKNEASLPALKGAEPPSAVPVTQADWRPASRSAAPSVSLGAPRSR